MRVQVALATTLIAVVAFGKVGETDLWQGEIYRVSVADGGVVTMPAERHLTGSLPQEQLGEGQEGDQLRYAEAFSKGWFGLMAVGLVGVDMTHPAYADTFANLRAWRAVDVLPAVTADIMQKLVSQGVES